MSQQRVDAVRAIYDDWGQGNFRAGFELYDRHAVLVQGPQFPDAGAVHGLEGIQRYMRGFLEAWEHLTISAEELLDAGDTVIVAVVQVGTGKGSGVRAELRYFHVWTFRGNAVIRLESVMERADALAAAGLSE